jgi:hypothetical protein
VSGDTKDCARYLISPQSHTVEAQQQQKKIAINNIAGIAGGRGCLTSYCVTDCHRARQFIDFDWK